MWRAFQVAAAVKVGETISGCRPRPARWELTRSTTWAARSAPLAGHAADGVQSPPAPAAGGGPGAAAARRAAARGGGGSGAWAGHGGEGGQPPTAAAAGGGTAVAAAAQSAARRRKGRRGKRTARAKGARDRIGACARL